MATTPAMHIVALELRDGQLVSVLQTPDEDEAQRKQTELDIQIIRFEPITVDGQTYRASQIETVHRFSAVAVCEAR